MQNAGLDEAQDGIKIAGRDDTTFMAESKELKSLLMKVKVMSEKSGLKLHNKKLRSWHPVSHFILLLLGILMALFIWQKSITLFPLSKF